jgi:hypothetical protein
LLYVVKFCIFPLFLRTGFLSSLERHVLLSLVCNRRWPESRSVGVTCYWLNVVLMYHLSGDAVCFVHFLGTILTVGDAVQTNLPISIQHSHLVLSSQVPIYMLSTMLAAVPLFHWPCPGRLPSSMAPPLPCPISNPLTVMGRYIGDVKYPEVYPAEIDLFEIFGEKFISLGQCFHHGDVVLAI